MERTQWLNLNGWWEFEIDTGLSGEEKGYPSGDKKLNSHILVPFCPESRLSGIEEKDFMPCVWYRKSFSVPAEWKGQRILLHFGAVDYDASVWINGQKAGSHRGGYSPFSFDITAFLQDGTNTIVLRAADDARNPLQPSGKQSAKLESWGCFYTRVTGIWQTVWIEPVPPVHISGFRIYPNIEKGEIGVFLKTEGETGRNLSLKTRVTAKGVKPVEKTISAGRFVFFSISLSDIRLWEPGNPFLYDIEFILEKSGLPADSVKGYFGLREISIDGKKVLLNGKPVFQRLVLDQGYYPDGIYTAPYNVSLKKDIELSMAMGFNGARLHQKVFEPHFLYWADKLGYLVWGEYPSWGLDHSHPESQARVLPEWLEVIERDFNHPSLIGWCPFNETESSQIPELLRNVYRLTKAVDPTRPVIDTSGYVHVETDIYDSHNYEQDAEKFASAFEGFKSDHSKAWINSYENNAPYKNQPYFVSEYGGIGWNHGQNEEKGWGYGEQPASEEEFLRRYKQLTETLLFHPMMFAFCYTQLYDVEQEINGLYTYDRKPKFDPDFFRKINTQKAAIEKT